MPLSEKSEGCAPDCHEFITGTERINDKMAGLTSAINQLENLADLIVEGENSKKPTMGECMPAQLFPLAGTINLLPTWLAESGKRIREIEIRIATALQLRG